MRTSPGRQPHRSALLALVILLVTAGFSVGFGQAAGAVTADHWVAGTYQAFAPGIGSGPMALILNANHTAVFVGGSTGTWLGGKHLVGINTSAPLPDLICVGAGQPPGCSANEVFNGPKTPAGIASQSAPGSAAVFLVGAFGSFEILSSPFWAVRTGGVRG
jgi:hypothetical protein